MPFFQCIPYRTKLDWTKSLSLSVISNKNESLLVKSNCNRTEYLCGPPCVRLTVEGEYPNEIDPFNCITVAIYIYIYIYIALLAVA